MAFLVKQVFFKNFPDRNSKNNDVIKYMPPFWIFFYETKDSMLVIMHAKFKVNIYCGWDFRQGGFPPPPPPHYAQTLLDTPCTIGLKNIRKKVIFVLVKELENDFATLSVLVRK